MSKIKRFISLFCASSIALSLASCSKAVAPVGADDFRVVSYFVCREDMKESDFDFANFDRITDIIVFGNATFDENGKVNLSSSFDDDLALIRKHVTNQRLYLNVLGPGSQSKSDDWNEQMYDLADRHTKAFESGNLEIEIKNTLDKYSFNGIVFDYEFPLRSKDWKAYDKFIISLDEALGDEYKIGMSMVSWNLKQSRKARNATDFFEIMSYDLWDNDGNHATMDIAKNDIKKMIKKGYDPATLDLGVPFYARPTTKEAYWYEYKSYYDKLDDNGLYLDRDTSLTFSFNTYDMIYDKTKWAMSNGVGGMMVWHYACDLPAENNKSLFVAIDNARYNK